MRYTIGCKKIWNEQSQHYLYVEEYIDSVVNIDRTIVSVGYENYTVLWFNIYPDGFG